MKVRALLLFALVASPLIASAAGRDEVRIEKVGGKYELRLSPAVAAAIKKAKPGFVLWNRADYLPNMSDSSPNALPFAAIGDVNNDGKKDLVVDGHDSNNWLVLVVLSSGTAYRAMELQSGPPVKPGDIKDCVDGKIHQGLNHNVWVDEAKAQVGLSYAQVSSCEGELLNDGGISSFNYRDGAFVAEDPVPL